ncbi:MAG: dockerin type I domain-containing protein [Verrucomicrobiota bacterium]
MKRKSVSQSAFFNLRTLLGFAVCLAGVIIALLGFGPNPAGSVMAQEIKQNQTNSGRPDVVQMVGPVSQDMDLRTLPYVPQGGETDEVRLMRHPQLKSYSVKYDPVKVMRKLMEPALMPAPLATYPGISSVESACGCLPPDTDGDVGPNHYIQAVNSSFKIFDKSGNQLMAATTYNSFFAPLGPTTPCGLQNQGDAVVFYDHQADRFVVTDFAFPSFPGASFYECIGVSKTSDPVAGGWWLYAIQIDPANPTQFGDYPKFSVWPDAYYMTTNLFTNSSTFVGVRVFALPRLAMINGTGAPNAGAVAFTIDAATLVDSYSLVSAGFRTGSPPPAGTDEYILSIDSPASGGVTLTQVHAWRFHVDFATPANSTLGLGANHAPNANITVNGFTDAFTTTSHLVPQSGTTRLLDTLGDKIMAPVVYQNRAGVESLWASHTINNNSGGTGPMAIRWYQFDVTGGTIPATPVQQQTFDNGADGLFRFMPSIAVDGNGNMAIGYATSSSTIFPGIRYAGRLAGDPLNTLAQGEAEMTAGGGNQSSSSSRWGDYSALNIDPADNSTFWHTNEYYVATGSATWNTRIGKFRFPPAALAMASAVSRKTQGAGTFDVALPGVECRSGGAGGSFTFVFTFNNTVVSGNAAVSGGAGSVLGSPAFSGNTMTVNLTGVANAQLLTVTLSSVTDAFAQTLPNTAVNASMLIGDTNANHVVNASDVAQTKSKIGQALSGTNFREDVNSNGALNGSDVSLVKAHIGDAAPAAGQ